LSASFASDAAAAAAAAAKEVEDGGRPGRGRRGRSGCVEESNVEAVCGWLAGKVRDQVSDEEWDVVAWEVLPRLEDVGIGHGGSLADALAVLRRRCAAEGHVVAAAGDWGDVVRGLDASTGNVLERVLGHLGGC
jgi:hypothetical protein